MSSFVRLTCEVSVDWNRTRGTTRVDQSTASLSTNRAKEVRGGLGAYNHGRRRNGLDIGSIAVDERK